MNAPDQCRRKMNTVHHCALRFITGCGSLVHHCALYAAAKLPSLLEVKVEVRTERGNKVLKHDAPSSWNHPQKDLK